MNNKIRTEPVVHRGEKRLKLIFEYDTELIQQVKQIPGCRWSQTMRCWHVPDNGFPLNFDQKLIEQQNEVKEESAAEPKKSGTIHFISITDIKRDGIFKIKTPYQKVWISKIRQLPGACWHPDAKAWTVFNGDEVLAILKEIFEGHYINFCSEKSRKRQHKKAVGRELIPKEYIDQLKLENLSKRTIEIYTSFVAQFLHYHKNKQPGDINDGEIRDYVLNCRERDGYSEAYQQQLVSSLKSFYGICYKREFEKDVLPRPKKGKRLPKVIPKEDVSRMIDCCSNRKHKMVIIMLYGFGLRLNELVKLQIRDLNFERLTLSVVEGKGRKDRTIPIPESLSGIIEEYIQDFLPTEYLIEGQSGGRYSGKSIQNVVRNAGVKAGIEKTITPHILRHCYGTHQLERGVDLRYIQQLMGHKSSKTTEIYTHVSVKKLSDCGSPLDDLDIAGSWQRKTKTGRIK